MHDLSMEEMRRYLHGLTIIFVGDSHSRYQVCIREREARVVGLFKVKSLLPLGLLF